MKNKAVVISVLSVLTVCSMKCTNGSTNSDDPDSGDAPGNGGNGEIPTQYRNLFAEIGKSKSEIDDKVDVAWNQLFYGDDDSERILYPVDDDMAYIYSVGEDDVRSEGMSYGMMIAVQLDKQEAFDRLWKWAKTYMLYERGRFEGWFGWQSTTDGDRIGTEPSPAPDGEEYMVTALFFASHRWGDGEGIFNYSKEANDILYQMLHQADDGLGENMFDPETRLVVFCPIGQSAAHTDPSYHLPGFYELWAKWADDDNDVWREVAKKSRAFLKTSTHPETGLNPDYAGFDGTPLDPNNQGHDDFQWDAWRVAINIGFDYGWWKQDKWQTTFADTLQGFFHDEGISIYGNRYTLDGSQIDRTHSTGLVAANAVAGLATESEMSREFTEELWRLGIPTGRWRYYDGMLYMLSLLHCSGKFRVW
jgi:oligosaccharide reducing-end xylanase